MMLFIYASIIIVIVYSIIYFVFTILFTRKENQLSQPIDKSVTIIIPFRNEEKNIEKCINSIINQQYDLTKVELICVNDHSSDCSELVLNKFKNIKIISLHKNQKGKKTAITEGIKNASNEIIIIRDADTISEKNWLNNLISKQNKTNADMVIGQINYKGSFSFLSALQIIEHLAITITGAATAKLGIPILCNGANLLFKKSAFIDVNGFADNERIASGDDIFLMNTFYNNKKKIEYCNSLDASVICETEKKWASFFSQRIRWSTKNKYNTNNINVFIMLLIFTTNIVLPTFSIISMFYTNIFPFAIIFILIKFLTDFFVIYIGSLHFKQLTILCWFPLVFFVFPLEILIILTLGIFYTPYWKERKI
jgi:cellulose synthase/poly-beta-1,6-N-acetylglucosamine synthase-like glycosyltransferase